jgi:hypothetical protein
VVRPCKRLAPARRHAQRALLRHCHRLLNRPVQLLRLECDQVRECDVAKLGRHVQDARDLDRQLVAWMGAPDVANLFVAGGRVWSVGLWDGASAAVLLTHFALSFFLTRCFQFLFNNLVQPPRFLRPSAGATSAPVVSVLAEAEEAGAPLLSGDVLDEPARSAADLGTGGYDVEPPEVQSTTRSRTRR